MAKKKIRTKKMPVEKQEKAKKKLKIRPRLQVKPVVKFRVKLRQLLKDKKTGRGVEASKADVHRTKIRVIGIGGGGGNIIAEIASIVPRVDFWTANADLQALKRTGKRCRHFAFGQNLTRGLGAGSDPKVGFASAKQSAEKISKLFDGIDLCILIACLGGGTGSGAAPIFAQLAKEKGCLTFGIFTLPFRFEGEKKMNTAKQALTKTTLLLNASVVLPNEKIFQNIDKETGFQTALSEVNKLLARDLKSLIETIYLPGLINIDFADLRTILSGEGKSAYLASATVQNGDGAEVALKELFAHPLNDYDPRGAEYILFNISSDSNISIDELNTISKAIFDLNPQAKIIFGVSQHPNLKKGLTVMLLAVGEVNKKTRDEKNKKVETSQVKRKKQTRKKVNAFSPRIKREIKKGPVGTQQTVPKSAPKSGTKTIKVSVKTSPEVLIPSAPVVKKRKGKKSYDRVKKGAQNRVLARARPQGGTAKHSSTTPKVAQRKSALELRRETELAEREQLAEERKWDVPAFLRRRV